MLTSRPVISKRRKSGWWRARPWEICCERTPAAIAGCLRRLPSHRALGGQEFLLRLPGASGAQAQCAVGGVCLHAPRRRHLRRSVRSRRAAPRKTDGVDECTTPRRGRRAHRRSGADGAGRYAEDLQHPARLAGKAGAGHGDGLADAARRVRDCATAVRNLRSALRLLLPRGFGRRAGLHSHLRLPRSARPKSWPSRPASPSSSPTSFAM